MSSLKYMFLIGIVNSYKHCGTRMLMLLKLTLPFPLCMNLVFVNLSVAQFPCLENGGNSTSQSYCED